MTSDPTSNPTPILDRLSPLPRSGKRRQTVAKIVGFFIGIGIGLYLASNPQMAISAILMLLPIVAIHEFAHAVTGMLSGFGVDVIKIGPFRFGGESDSKSMNDFLGYVSFRIDRVSRIGHRMFWVVAMGPAANFVTAFLALMLKHSRFLVWQSWLTSLTEAFFWMSLAIGLLSVVPLSGSSSCDGGRMLALWKPTQKGKRFLALLGILSMRDRGIMPRHWNERWLGNAMIVDDQSVDAVGLSLMAYAAASDRKDVSLASLRLEQCLKLSAKMNSRVRDVLMYEAAYFQAWFRQDSQKSGDWYRQIAQPQVLTLLLTERYKAALSCSLKQFPEALAAWERGLSIVRSRRESIRRDALERSWIEWGDEIRQRQAAEAGVMAAVQ